MWATVVADYKIIMDWLITVSYYVYKYRLDSVVKNCRPRGAIGYTLASHRCAGVPSSRVGHSMSDSWWTKRDLGRFFSRVSPVFPYHKFHSTISPHSYPFRFISSVIAIVRQVWPVGFLIFTDLQYRGFIASHPWIRPCSGHELRMLRDLLWAVISFYCSHVLYSDSSFSIHKLLYFVK